MDYYRRPKLAYHKLKQLYNPVLISLDYPLIEYRPGAVLRAEVWAINDLLQSFEGCWLQILLDGEEIFSQVIDLPPYPFSTFPKGSQFILARLGNQHGLCPLIVAQPPYPGQLIFDRIVEPTVTGPQFATEHLGQGQIVAVVGRWSVEPFGQFPGYAV